MSEEAEVGEPAGLLEEVVVAGGRLKCFVDTCRIDHGLRLLSLVGQRNAVRAAWASLATRVSTLNVGGANVMMSKDENYLTSSASIGYGLLHMVIATERLSPLKTPPAAGEFYLRDGPTRERDFFLRLDSMCPVPFRASWAPALWTAGLEGERPRIRLCSGFGIACWFVSTEQESWHAIVKDLLSKGTIK